MYNGSNFIDDLITFIPWTTQSTNQQKGDLFIYSLEQDLLVPI